ncbi:MAG: hypothetical protein LUE21_07210, partial [Oscillospiraceae bacterium]|nr:hypothetical protein [Oscillospiraceae bacterium]
MKPVILGLPTDLNAFVKLAIIVGIAIVPSVPNLFTNVSNTSTSVVPASTNAFILEVENGKKKLSKGAGWGDRGIGG